MKEPCRVLRVFNLRDFSQHISVARLLHDRRLWPLNATKPGLARADEVAPAKCKPYWSLIRFTVFSGHGTTASLIL